ncbi:MAG: patatin-like phospholipase family protein [Gammaproteobacteria bacterium]|nr:patatin-like phospholipase family protein [Gammaproteobacteria bacterium]
MVRLLMVDGRFKLVPIFAGGGTRLTAHVGVIKALEELDVQMDHLVATSGGSIVAALYAAGFSTERLKELAFNADFKRFRGFSMFELLRRGGLCSGVAFETWLDGLLEGQTFAQLPRELHIVATDVRYGQPVVFDKVATPDIKISRAVRFSMGVPLVFTFQEYHGHLLVDGSILSEDALHRDWAGDGTPVYCFRMRNNKDKPSEPLPLRPWWLLADYANMLIQTFLLTLSREFVNAQYWHRTVVIDTGNLSPLSFSLSEEQKAYLYRQGYETTLTFLPRKMGLESSARHAHAS